MGSKEKVASGVIESIRMRLEELPDFSDYDEIQFNSICEKKPKSEADMDWLKALNERLLSELELKKPANESEETVGAEEESAETETSEESESTESNEPEIDEPTVISSESEDAATPEVDVKELCAEVEHKKKFSANIRKLMEAYGEAKENASIWGKEAKALNDRIIKEVSAFCRDNDTPLFDIQPPTETASQTAEDAGESASDPDVWKEWPIGDHFALTDKEYEKLELSEVSPISKLSEAVNLLAGGGKIKGLGEKFTEKITEQFDNFFASAEYQAICPKADAPTESDQPESESDLDRAKSLIASIRGLQENYSFDDFDFETFQSIAEQVDLEEYVSENQIVALENILTGLENMEQHEDAEDLQLI